MRYNILFYIYIILYYIICTFIFVQTFIAINKKIKIFTYNSLIIFKIIKLLSYQRIENSLSSHFPWIEFLLFHIKSAIIFSESNVQWKWRRADKDKCFHATITRAKSTACVLSCVVGNGPPARTTSHCYLLVSVSLGGKSISFRRYCADLFVQVPKRSPHLYPVIPVQQKAEKECGDCWKRKKKEDHCTSRKIERQNCRAIV